MNRYAYARCLCPCGAWIVLNVTRHTVVGYATDAWDAAHVTDLLNRGLAVVYSEETPA
jgi:glucan phosphorylase